jgi:hypothetical protein
MPRRAGERMRVSAASSSKIDVRDRSGCARSRGKIPRHADSSAAHTAMAGHGGGSDWRCRRGRGADHGRQCRTTRPTRVCRRYPIKHARRIATPHRRYAGGFEYGDGDAYRRGVPRMRLALQARRSTPAERRRPRHQVRTQAPKTMNERRGLHRNESRSAEFANVPSLAVSPESVPRPCRWSLPSTPAGR